MPAEIGVCFVKLYPRMIAAVFTSRLLLTLLLTIGVLVLYIKVPLARVSVSPRLCFDV
jgi:hypothetical protein